MILYIQPTYNEKIFLEPKMGYCDQQGLKFYYLDNMSGDGSWEHFNEVAHKYRCVVGAEQFDTDGKFSLYRNNMKCLEVMDRLKPDWVIIGGADMFYYAVPFKIDEFIRQIDIHGFNCVDTSKMFTFYYTGYERRGDPRFNYFYYSDGALYDTRLIFKYNGHVTFNGDVWSVVPERLFKNEKDIFRTFHYKYLKGWKERNEILLSRRELAWDDSTDRTLKSHGSHYKNLAEIKGEETPQDRLSDIRKSKFWEIMSNE
jgi:hypothetical protein